MTHPANSIKLGQTLRDVVTGFTGIAVNKTYYLNGNIQYNLQPTAKGDVVYPDTISIDYHTLDIVDEGVSARVTEGTFESPVQLGNIVLDIVSGATGIATMKTDYLNGCSAYLVMCKFAETTADGKTHSEDWIDQTRLQVVNEGVANKLLKPAKASNGLQPGGPVLRGIPRGC